MNDVIRQMLAAYDRRRVEDYGRALRDILQQIALLGLWRVKFFEKAAFYGGTALRILHGMDRFSEDLDFSLLRPMPGFRLSQYTRGIETEIRSYGFDVQVTSRPTHPMKPVQSAFLKADTLSHLFLIEAEQDVLRMVPRGQVLKIKVEVDTDPPGEFETETAFLLRPIPFSVRAYSLPDLFAGKMHAVLCRRWKSRVKGRDWYDFVWYVTHHPELHLAHLQSRMRQTGHLEPEESLTDDLFRIRLSEVIGRLDVEQARREVEPFVETPASLTVWSRDFFHAIGRRIRIV
jgi:predicted nucleotidyltransferase component of viral defense system